MKAEWLLGEEWRMIEREKPKRRENKEESEGECFRKRVKEEMNVFRQQDV